MAAVLISFTQMVSTNNPNFISQNCKVTTCENEVKHKLSGFCLKHYACWKRTGDPVAKSKPHVHAKCTVAGCLRPHRRRGFCEMHSKRMSRHGDIETHFFIKYKTDEERKAGIKISKAKYKKTIYGKAAGRIKRQRRRSKKLDDIRLTAAQMILLLEIFQNQCFRCKSADDLTFDHHVPLTFGGKLDMSNTVVLCRSCNGKKWKFRPQEFYSETELVALNTVLDALKIRLSLMPKLTLLYGAHGAGKTTLAKFLEERYHVVHSDQWKNKKALMEMLVDSTNKNLDKPLLLETPRGITNYLARLTEVFQVNLVLLDEPDAVMEERLRSRGGVYSDAIKNTKKTMLRYHRRYGGFKGDYLACLEYLKTA